MRPVLRRLTKQYNLGPWLGGLKDLASRAIFYLSLLNFVQISATFYYLTLRPNYLQYISWLNFWTYFGTLTFLVLIVMILEYKFIIPSMYTFLNRQEYLHQNLLKKDLKEILDKLKKIEGELNESRNNSSDKES